MIRSLNIQVDHPSFLGLKECDNSYDTLIRIDWVFQTIKLCPSLQELTIPGYQYEIESDYILSQYLHVRKLSINQISDKSDTLPSIEQQLSLSFSNLKHLRLSHYRRNKNDNSYPGVVSMPSARLDLLEWKNLLFHYDDQESFELYVKLEMNTGVKFYKRNSQTGVLAIDEQQYNQSETKFRFEITYFSLAKLVIYDDRNTTTNVKLLELIL